MQFKKAYWGILNDEINDVERYGRCYLRVVNRVWHLRWPDIISFVDQMQDRWKFYRKTVRALEARGLTNVLRKSSWIFLLKWPPAPTSDREVNDWLWVHKVARRAKHANFRWLVLGCMEADFCDRLLFLQTSSGSTRLARLQHQKFKTFLSKISNFIFWSADEQ